MRARDFDVVLFGASGFTGRQTVEYFARSADTARLRWAIAGRHREALEAVVASIGATTATPEILVADSRDQASIDAAVGRTHVLLSTAGPFRQYGTAVVDACVRFKTHHVNITGETAWVRAMIDRYHDRAAASGTRIVPFCGFDSVPSDIGAYLLARHARLVLGASCREVRAYFQMRGGVNGGTIATAFDATHAANAAEMSDPFLLDASGERDAHVEELSRDLRAPRYDAELGTWIGPFVMAPTNTRVVRRSASFARQWGESYGPEFIYQEYLKFNPPFARARAMAATMALGLFLSALRRPLTRRMLQRVLPSPGSGPSRESIEHGWFTCELRGSTTSGKRLRGVIRHQGDPSNHATVTYVCESALALVHGADALPGGPERGGVLTPATAFGDVLVDRLRTVGVRIDIQSDP